MRSGVLGVSALWPSSSAMGGQWITSVAIAAMNFQELLKGDSSVDPATLQQQAVARFPEEVRRHGMNLWRPGDPLNDGGLRFLLGVAASYSQPDLELMDDLDGAIRRGILSMSALDVFDISTITTMSEFEIYIPGIGHVFQTPVLGVWVNGILTERLQGFHARQRMLKALSGSL